MKKIIIAGGTGFIGTYLTMRFTEMGYKVYIISRTSGNISWENNAIVDALEGAELVINLAGKSIQCRHTNINKKSILESRIESTTLIGDAILSCKKPPKLWINASGTSIYKQSNVKKMTEDETDLGTDFLAEVVVQWENTLFNFQTPTTRQVALRTSVVIGKNGGALQPLVWLTRFGLGGKQGDGNQILSWIHIEDYFKILLFLFKNQNINGVINCTSPNPVSNKEFMTSLQNTLRIPIGIPAPKFAIKLVSKILGIESDLILNSSFTEPKRLLEAGYKFHFPLIDKALVNLLK